MDKKELLSLPEEELDEAIKGIMLKAVNGLLDDKTVNLDNIVDNTNVGEAVRYYRSNCSPLIVTIKSKLNETE